MLGLVTGSSLVDGARLGGTLVGSDGFGAAS